MEFIQSFWEGFSSVISYLREFNLISVLLRIALSVVLAGLVGMERGDHNRPAGFRTHVLVCLGSTLVMITSQYINYYFVGITADPARLGAQVISGIGFLGAGTIIINGSHVRGLTTAAGLWAVACVGIALGIGFYEGAIIGALVIYCSLTYLSRMSRKMRHRSTHVELYVETTGAETLPAISSLASIKNCKITHIEFNETPYVNRDSIAMTFSLQVPRGQDHFALLAEVEKLSDVLYTEEINS